MEMFNQYGYYLLETMNEAKSIKYNLYQSYYLYLCLVFVYSAISLKALSSTVNPPVYFKINLK